MEKLISIKELMRKSIAMYREHWVTFVLLSLVGMAAYLLMVPAWLLFDENSMYVTKPLFIGAGVMVALVAGLISVAIGLLVKIALMYVVKERGLKLKDYLTLAWKNALSYLWVSFLFGLAIFGGIILLIIPGIIFSVWFYFATYVFVFEGTTGVAALKRSKELVQGYWWAVAGRLLVFGIIMTAISWIPLFGVLINVFVATPIAVIYSYYLYESLKQAKSVISPV